MCLQSKTSPPAWSQHLLSLPTARQGGLKEWVSGGSTREENPGEMAICNQSQPRAPSALPLQPAPKSHRSMAVPFHILVVPLQQMQSFEEGISHQGAGPTHSPWGFVGCCAPQTQRKAAQASIHAGGGQPGARSTVTGHQPVAPHTGVNFV